MRKIDAEDLGPSAPESGRMSSALVAMAALLPAEPSAAIVIPPSRSARAQQRGVERRQPGRIERREISAARGTVGDQLGQGFAVAGALRMPQTLWPVAT
jgi:hypothetical protein